MADEYALDDFLADPVTRMLMARDHVQEADIRSLADRFRAGDQQPFSRPPEPRSFEA